ncbi:MAG TPA: hypothetical protein VK066_27520 [Chloroflexota bacterium]|nr:hypothetical protein [Chloroflexota bacterium]
MSRVRHSSIRDADDNTYRDTLDQLQVGEELRIALDRDQLDAEAARWRAAAAAVSAEVEISTAPGDRPDRGLLRLVKRGIRTGAEPQPPSPPPYPERPPESF